MPRVILFRDYTGAEYGIDTPLTSKIDLREISKKLNIPAFVNTGSFVMERAIEEILKVVPIVEKKWNSPWWNEDVETPDIFGKVKSQQH
jgi:hypothetical protein